MSNYKSIPYFPAPCEAIVIEAKEGSRTRACKAWIAEARATLWNGTEVRPSLGCASRTMRAIAKGMPACNIVVEVGNYTRALSHDELASRVRADKLRSERFDTTVADAREFPRYGFDTCDRCQHRGFMINHYAPDGWGTPAHVLSHCAFECSPALAS